jgi:hypothetical protein
MRSVYLDYSLHTDTPPSSPPPLELKPSDWGGTTKYGHNTLLKPIEMPVGFKAINQPYWGGGGGGSVAN